MSLYVSTDDLDELVGATLPGRSQAQVSYRLEKRLAGGSQGCAFLATRSSAVGFDNVVVKIWRPSFVVAQPEIARLVVTKESVALARLNQRVPPTPFVVQLLDGGELEVMQRRGPLALPWLTLEYVHGGALGTTLRDRVEECVRSTGYAFAPARVHRLLANITDGVIAVHEVGVVHRDLKPTNVLLCGVGVDELAKVSDFGLARPMGLSGTFGQLAVGTPGYAAPEQMDTARVGFWSDVFSVAALAFYAIAGEDMFEGTGIEQMTNAYNGTFSPAELRGRVHPEWKKGNHLVRIETVLRRATRKDLQARIPSIRELWSALEPPIRDAESGGELSLAAGTARTLHDHAAQPWSFRVAHREPGALRLRTVAFDPDGHGLAAGESGLFYWEGTHWRALKTPPGLDAPAVRVLARLAPWRWLGAGDAGSIALFSPYVCEASYRIGDGRHTISCAGIVSERDLTLCGNCPGQPPVLVSCHGGVWRAPVVVEFAQTITSITLAAPDVWWLTGVDPQGRGLLATYWAESGTVHRWMVDSAPLLAGGCDSQGTCYAVGAGGFAFAKGQGHPVLERVMTHRAMTAMAVDPADGVWACANGRIMHRPPDPTATWIPLWSDNAWQSPFVSVAAMSGMVVAAAEDGSVVVGHQGL